MNFVNIKYLNLLLSFFNFNFSFFQGYIFCKILCLGGRGNGAGEKNENEINESDSRSWKRSQSGAVKARDEITQGFQDLEGLRGNGVIKKKSDVWKAIDEHYPECIKSAARVILAMPPTQVSVERLFSSLKILKSDRRNRLKADLLDAMLFLRSNCSKN